MEKWTSCLYLLIVLPQLITATSWNYNDTSGYGPSDWSTTYANCAGSNQSPIDITGAEYDSSLESFTFTGYSAVDSATDYSLGNNGHSAEVWLATSSMTVSGGSLGATYTMAQFHIHWGSSSATGSEHTVDGTQYAAEIHLVHYNSDDYGSFSAAYDQPSGLAVLGILVEEEGSDNSALSTVFDDISDVSYPTDAAVDITKFAIEDLLPEDPEKYYRYNGSLTTPSCDESVIWTVFKEHISLSTSQMSSLRALFEDDNSTALEDNYRPVQALNGRTISMSWNTGTDTGVVTMMSWTITVLMSLVVLTLQM